jgi:aryl-alcohol dehydrogenase-like predicted oxidoreductase
MATSEKIFGDILKRGYRMLKLVLATKSGQEERADIPQGYMIQALKPLAPIMFDIYHLQARDTPTAIPDEAP